MPAYRELILLLIWTAIAAGLRFTQLAAKPPWTDEFSTIVFSLGNSFTTVPLDRIISLDMLLQPLQPNPNAGVVDVVKHLTTESNHPPLYFILAHWWMNLSPALLDGVWGARSLAAILGAASIPAIYALSFLAFRSQLVAHLAAAIMAVSPYGIFIAQEARHYTLGILWIIASLACLVIASQHMQKNTRFPPSLAFVWVLINFLGISTHYFFIFTLCTEAFWLIFLALVRKKHFSLTNPLWWQIFGVGFGTMVGCLFWFPVYWQGSNRSELSEWIKTSDRAIIDWIAPIFQALGTWISMLYLLPVSAMSIAVVIVSAIAMLLIFIWIFPILKQGYIIGLKHPHTSLMFQLFTIVVVGAIAQFFFFTYVFGIDLTRGARYNFVYFPAFIIILAASLAVCWNTPPKLGKIIPTSGKVPVALIWLIATVSGLIVVYNLGYPKYYRPDLLVPLIKQVSQSPILIATTHKSHVQIGEMMGIASSFKLSKMQTNPQFLLAKTANLQQTLTQLPQPIDLWLVNFRAPANLNNCTGDRRSFPLIYGYEYKLYHCQ